MMPVDIRTISLVLGVTHLMQILVFFFQYISNRNIKGPFWWLLWCIAEASGFILIIIRKIPELTAGSIIFQNPFIIAGTIFIYIGIFRFFNKKVNLKFILSFFVGFVILHLFFFLIIDDILIRSIIFSVFISAIAFITAIKLNKFRTKENSYALNFNIVVFLVHGFIFLYRAVQLSFDSQLEDLYSTSFFNVLPYLDALLVSLLWTFGFIMMVNQRLNSDVLEAKERFEIIFDTSPDAVLISRLSDGRMISCNESFSKINGFSKDEIIGKSTLDINIWENSEDRAHIVKMIRETGHCEGYETKFKTKFGQIFTGLFSAKSFLLSGEPHIISVTHDITNRKINEELIKTKNEELNIINAEKDKFFSIIAHDLRSPINGFIGMTEIMAEKSQDMELSKLQHLARNMRDSAANLFRLLENLLEWSRLQQGSTPFNPAKYDFRELIDESIAVLIQSANSKDIEIHYDFPSDFQIFADKDIIQTVIRNLVSNSIKFTARGGSVAISAKVLENNTVEVAVTDTGIGMNPALVDNLFKLTAKTGRRGTEGEASTGLGLLLCKDFITKHGGKIRVESAEGKGSAFYFSIPAIK